MLTENWPDSGFPEEIQTRSQGRFPSPFKSFHQFKRAASTVNHSPILKLERRMKKPQAVPPISPFGWSCSGGRQTTGVQDARGKWSYRRWKETKMGKKAGQEGTRRGCQTTALRDQAVKRTTQHWSVAQYCLIWLHGVISTSHISILWKSFKWS